ncbi:DNA-processing protein DprA [Campylobacter helveticus]|uniref:DNA-processing protein DprA n=1 Tax=Campylobacter helveticus TaxID=28898 RepID=A0AAX2UHW9_9BACT|nr:DNA-processing protein DprA [Campylobacter helveticus]ARE80466.1 DNA protecting protein DprA [Campylobacter helveticus]MCR2039796.1 DNA-protecting protein DprA [Campylobacter helveticus]MCR2055022.1 DNA-protecting protein DprA [Campylobacter helveticus]MCR2056328.1 DNA-protecting protein DprA [Campylobacter helveticus]MCR2063899.1 DNA-protecting protein DprA [Campylobacter helveticus]
MSELLPSSYLNLFSSLKDEPKKLYFKGNLKLLSYPKVAIIGSRKMSIYTKNCVLDLATTLKNAGVCVVSGGALGVDINAALASLPLHIGIFANGLGQIYPRTNENIIKEIYAKGLALSENEDNYMPQGFDFLLRNRLIIALSDAVVVAQADLQSGSMQSARLSYEMQKPLFVLPQRLEESRGTNLLLQDKKANLIADFKAFAAHFGSVKEDVGEKDEFLQFCQKGVRVEEALEKFGEKVYEYELEGKIAIEGVFIRLLK